MINTQLIPRGIRDRNLLSVMEKIPRHIFVPKNLQTEAYEDHPLPIGEGQTISQPYMVAWMTESLKLTGLEKVLEIGTGSGYQTAILAELSKEVYTVETIASLSVNSQENLRKLNYKNIFFKIDDGTIGWSDKSPFDRIIVTAGANDVPPPLFEQLSENGRMLIPIGERHMQDLFLVEKINGKMQTDNLGSCVFVPLTGRHGMKY